MIQELDTYSVGDGVGAEKIKMYGEGFDNFSLTDMLSLVLKWPSQYIVKHMDDSRVLHTFSLNGSEFVKSHSNLSTFTCISI